MSFHSHVGLPQIARFACSGGDAEVAGRARRSEAAWSSDPKVLHVVCLPLSTRAESRGTAGGEHERGRHGSLGAPKPAAFVARCFSRPRRENIKTHGTKSSSPAVPAGPCSGTPAPFAPDLPAIPGVSVVAVLDGFVPL